ncbi:MAG: hypothetical protein K6T78_12910 [Alicyclobacillus sp.]|nr:hypothetical protein [Alicyclobacillus sp.]
MNREEDNLRHLAEARRAPAELSFWARWRPYLVRIVLGLAIGIVAAVAALITGKRWIVDDLATLGMVVIAFSGYAFVGRRQPGGQSLRSSSSGARAGFAQQMSWFWTLFLVAFPMLVVAVLTSVWMRSH